MLPFFAVGIIAALVGYSVGKKPNSKSNNPPSVRGYLPPTTRFQIGKFPQAPKQSYVDALNACVDRGDEPSEQLINAAIVEAHKAGDRETVEMIAFLYKSEEMPAPKKQDETPKSETETETDTPNENQDQAFDIASPIEGVADQDWQAFIETLETKDPSYTTDKHIGAYEHNRSRLKTLGLDAPKTKAEQYDALELDLLDHYERARKLINEQCGECIQLDGSDQYLSMSGIMALLKAGGVKSAQEWLTKPEARAKFPRTKELFLKANGIF